MSELSLHVSVDVSLHLISVGRRRGGRLNDGRRHHREDGRKQKEGRKEGEGERGEKWEVRKGWSELTVDRTVNNRYELNEYTRLVIDRRHRAEVRYQCER